MTRQRLPHIFLFVCLAVGMLVACTRFISPTPGTSPLASYSPLATPGVSPLAPRSPLPTLTRAVTPTADAPAAALHTYLPMVAANWSAPTPAPTPTATATRVPPPYIPNVIIPKNLGGLHVEATGDHTGYEEFLRACAADNRPVALIKVYGDGYSAKIAKEIDPRTVTIWRKPAKVGHADYSDNPPGDWNWPADQTADVARRWMEAMYPDWDNQRQYIDYFEVVNEPNMATMTQTLRAVDFMMDVMKLAEQHDPPYHLAIWSFSSGTPEPWQAELIAPTLRYAAQHGHILSVHDGSVDADRRLFQQAYKDGTALRYRMFQPLLGQDMPPVAITEAYQPDGYFKPDYADWQWYLTELDKDNVIGAAWFTLGPYSFTGSGPDVNVVGQLPYFALALGCR